MVLKDSYIIMKWYNILKIFIINAKEITTFLKEV